MNLECAARASLWTDFLSVLKTLVRIVRRRAVVGRGISEWLFENGLCLPSGSALTEEDLSRVCKVVRKAWPR